MPTVFVYSIEDTVELAKTLHANGVHVIELLQRTEPALEAIRAVKEKVPGIIVGAGTVLNTETASKVYEKGADFIVSPYYHQKIVDWANEHELAVIPGCATISEISRGYDSGLKYFKLFPANQLGGPAMVRQISEIYNDARYIPAGGITFEDVKEYAKSKFIAALGTVCIMPSDLIAAHKWDEIAYLTRKTISVTLGLKLVYAADVCDALGEVGRFLEETAENDTVPTEIFLTGDKPDLGFCTYSIERAMGYFGDRGMTGIIIKKTADGLPAVADMVDDKSGKRIRLVVRHSL
ncbi:MAG: bifunctional 4-hydroxy-2-oxoglutarate aldolase/2-dehydro-3-deoxy-phosphogluconate aldolase [Clostridiales bacterium]|nr:bifunctional 4-hydroxy-2-oxoglutarate aldolase/2-dehydro-3-deoxy-phosphogluconate aldolase [Clostridiales bacterium]